MVAVIAGIVAVAVTLVVLGVLGYGLTGQLRRLSRAVAEARSDVTPKVDALTALAAAPRRADGRHLRVEGPSGAVEEAGARDGGETIDNDLASHRRSGAPVA